LRKCSAASLDLLANLFKNDLLKELLPILKESLTKNVNWKVKESAVLALGAIAEGCFSSIEGFLKDLVPYLIDNLKHPKSLVRSITCWTLSRYSKWIVREQDDSKYLVPLLDALLARIMDKSKKVQEAACSAFATLEEEAQERLAKYLKPILTKLMQAFDHYQAKNMLILYDALGTLAEAVGNELNKTEYIKILMPPLMIRWNALKDDDRNIFPLLECLTSIAQALGTGFAPFAKPVFIRCLKIISNTLVSQEAAVCVLLSLFFSPSYLSSSSSFCLLALSSPIPCEQILNQKNNQKADFPDKEFLVCALDLLSGLAEGLEGSIETLVGDSNILDCLTACIQDGDPDVRQSAFALLGDLAKACIVRIFPIFRLCFSSFC
jgi:transportin-1